MNLRQALRRRRRPPTRFGMSVSPKPEETAAEALARLQEQFGQLGVLRVFDQGLMPAQWSNQRHLAAANPKTLVVYSWKGDMNLIAAGAYDERLDGFIRSRPSGVKVHVCLHHEPEDDVERGVFTTEQFRAATAHVAPIVKAAGGIPTSVLMAYSLSPRSKRNWRDYFVPEIASFSWDAYNTAQKKDAPSYKPVAKFLDPMLAARQECKRPFGIAEFGSPVIPGDSGEGRAKWLTEVGTGFIEAGAQFVSYWNRPAIDDPAVDFSLHDAPSAAAWRQLVTR